MDSLNSNFFKDVASRLQGTQQRCGSVAGGIWEWLTSSSRFSLDVSHKEGCWLTEAQVTEISEPVPEGCVRVVGLTLKAKEIVDHQMVFAVLPNRTVHTMQVYYPMIRRLHSWSMPAETFQASLNQLVRAAGQKWTPEYSSTFDRLTRISYARRRNDEFLLVCPTDPVADDELPLGQDWLTSSRRAIAPHVAVCVATVPAPVA